MPTEAPTAQGRDLRPPVLPTVLVVVLLVAAGCLASGWFRSQVGLSLSRKPVAFVEVGFTDPAAMRACALRDGHLPVAFTIVAHGGATRALRYDAEVRPQHGRATVLPFSTTVRPDRSTRIRWNLAVPAKGAYDVVVRLRDGSGQRLSVHCGGAPR